MTTLTPKILREAVELAEWKYDNGRVTVPNLGGFWIHELPPEIIAALASQLKSQVNSTDFVVSEHHNMTIIFWSGDFEDPRFMSEGPVPDENSIIACVEFLRERA